MPLPALILLLAAAPPQTGASSAIVVTAHPWAPFISPMGEPFRARTTADDTLARWFEQADRNHDGRLTADEMQGDADRFFATLDTDRDGEIGPEELVRYEWEIAPEIQVNSRTRRPPGEVNTEARRSGRWRPGENDEDDPGVEGRRERHREKPGGLQGAARYALLNIPEPVATADTDFDRGVSRSEFREAALARFKLLDTAHQGSIGLTQLEALRGTLRTARDRPKSRDDAADQRIGNPLPPGN